MKIFTLFVLFVSCVWPLQLLSDMREVEESEGGRLSLKPEEFVSTTQ